MTCSLRKGTGAALVVVTLLGSTSDLTAQRGELDLTVEAPASLAPAADRVRRMDRQPLAEALARAGLIIPPQIHVTLIAEDDLRARGTPAWIVGLASGPGLRGIAIFPERIGVWCIYVFNLLKNSQLTIPRQTEMLSECLVPCCGISSARSASSMASSLTP